MARKRVWSASLDKVEKDFWSLGRLPLRTNFFIMDSSRFLLSALMNPSQEEEAYSSLAIVVARTTSWRLSLF